MPKYNKGSTTHNGTIIIYDKEDSPFPLLVPDFAKYHLQCTVGYGFVNVFCDSVEVIWRRDKYGNIAKIEVYAYIDGKQCFEAHPRELRDNRKGFEKAYPHRE